MTFEDTFAEKTPVECIVKVGRELLTPTVKAKVEEVSRWRTLGPGGGEGDEGMVACPGVVIPTRNDGDGKRCLCRQQFPDGIRFLCRNEQRLIATDDFSQRHISPGDVAKVGSPIRLSMWPRQLDSALRLPFCRKPTKTRMKFLSIHVAKVRRILETSKKLTLLFAS